MGIVYVARGSITNDAPYLSVAQRNTWVLGDLLKLPDSFEGEMPARIILRKILAIKRNIEANPRYLEERMEKRNRKVARFRVPLLPVNVEYYGPQARQYLDDLEKVARFAGPRGTVLWG